MCHYVWPVAESLQQLFSWLVIRIHLYHPCGVKKPRPTDIPQNQHLPSYIHQTNLEKVSYLLEEPSFTIHTQKLGESNQVRPEVDNKRWWHTPITSAALTVYIGRFSKVKGWWTSHGTVVPAQLCSNRGIGLWGPQWTGTTGEQPKILPHSQHFYHTYINSIVLLLYIQCVLAFAMEQGRGGGRDSA